MRMIEINKEVEVEKEKGAYGIGRDTGKEKRANNL